MPYGLNEKYNIAVKNVFLVQEQYKHEGARPAFSGHTKEAWAETRMADWGRQGPKAVAGLAASLKPEVEPGNLTPEELPDADPDAILGSDWLWGKRPAVDGTRRRMFTNAVWE